MMSAAPDREQSSSRFERLSLLLEQDPSNSRLLADAAEAAFEEDRFRAAGELLDQHAAIAPLAPETRSLAGLVAMREEDWPRAAGHFERLLADGWDQPPVRFNLAWSRAMAKEFDTALAVLDAPTARELPQAAQLLVQLLHERGDFEEAEARARELIELHPDHRGLNAAVATLAIDVEDTDLAARCASRAGDHPDALATLGTLALGEDSPARAAELFDAALARNPTSPRAWVGRGLARLIEGDKAMAAAEIDKGAELFGTHIGSWIASGWAHFVAGDIAAAKARFETALQLDDNFGESHGSLAVVDIFEGDAGAARQRMAVALRLDRDSFSGALAAMLLAAGAGDTDKARRIFDTALNTPIDGQGRTVAQALARLGTTLG